LRIRDVAGGSLFQYPKGLEGGNIPTGASRGTLPRQRPAALDSYRKLMWIERERESRAKRKLSFKPNPLAHPSAATDRRDLRKLDTHLLFQVRHDRNRLKEELLKARRHGGPRANPKHCHLPTIT